MSEPRQTDHDLLVRLDTKVDILLGHDRDKESRLRALERRVWVATGAAGALGAIVGWALQLVGH